MGADAVDGGAAGTAASLSAADGLGVARDTLRAALNGLTLVGVAQERDTFPTEPSLACNYPNPFSNVTTITWSLPYEGKVTLEILNLFGVTVQVLVQARDNWRAKPDEQFEAKLE